MIPEGKKVSFSDCCYFLATEQDCCEPRTQPITDRPLALCLRNCPSRPPGHLRLSLSQCTHPFWTQTHSFQSPRCLQHPPSCQPLSNRYYAGMVIHINDHTHNMWNSHRSHTSCPGHTLSSPRAPQTSPHLGVASPAHLAGPVCFLLRQYIHVQTQCEAPGRPGP